MPYVVMGGLALNAWGLPRATFDIDIAVGADAPAIAGLLNRLDEAGFDVPAEYRRGYEERFAEFRMVKAHAYPRAGRVVTVDLFIVDTPFQRSALARRVRIDLLGREMWVVSAADLLLFKLMAWRRKDQLDIQNVLMLRDDRAGPAQSSGSISRGVPSSRERSAA